VRPTCVVGLRYFHQIDPDQDGCFRFWTTTLQPALVSLGAAPYTSRS
jgi:hypothetical protein